MKKTQAQRKLLQVCILLVIVKQHLVELIEKMVPPGSYQTCLPRLDPSTEGSIVKQEDAVS